VVGLNTSPEGNCFSLFVKKLKLLHENENEVTLLFHVKFKIKKIIITYPGKKLSS